MTVSTSVREVELLSTLVYYWEMLHIELCHDEWPHTGSCVVPPPESLSHEEVVDALAEMRDVT